jgi:twitching motility protein PilI
MNDTPQSTPVTRQGENSFPHNGSRRPWKLPSQALQRSFTLPSGQSQLRPAVADPKQTSRVEYRGFHVGELGLLIATHLTGQLLMLPNNLCRIPNTASWVLGLVNLQGQLVPVFDTHHLFELPAARPAKAWLLILGQEKAAAGLVIDEIPFAKPFTADQRLRHHPLLPELLEIHKLALYKDHEGLWVEFDPMALFTSLGEGAVT